MSAEITVPTEEEIAQLPRWARVAFAARCARLAQQAFIKGWPGAPQEHLDAVEQAICLAERSSNTGISDAAAVITAASAADSAAHAASNSIWADEDLDDEDLDDEDFDDEDFDDEDLDDEDLDDEDFDDEDFDDEDDLDEDDLDDDDLDDDDLEITVPGLSPPIVASHKEERPTADSSKPKTVENENDDDEFDDDDDFDDDDFDKAANAAAAAARAIVDITAGFAAAAVSAAAKADNLLIPTICRDFERLRTLHQEQGWTDQTLIPITVFDAQTGSPNPDSLTPESPQLPRKVRLVLTATLPDRVDPDSLSADLIELYHAANEAHIARGGAGLSLEDFRREILARVPEGVR